jgi:hypothetical protein
MNPLPCSPCPTACYLEYGVSTDELRIYDGWSEVSHVVISSGLLITRRQWPYSVADMWLAVVSLGLHLNLLCEIACDFNAQWGQLKLPSGLDFSLHPPTSICSYGH